MSTSTNNSIIVKNSVFMSIRMVIVLFITLYTSRVVLESLGVVNYGIHNVVAGFVTMFAFMGSALSAGIQRFYNFELGQSGVEGANRVYNTALIIQCVFALLLVIIIEFVGLWYLHNKMVIPIDRMQAASYIFQLAVITLVLHIIQVPYSAAVMAHEKMGFYAVMSIFSAAGTLLGVYLIKFIQSDSLILYGILLSIIAAITLISYIVYCKFQFKEIHLTKGINKSLFKEMLTFSGWNVLGTFGHMLKDQGINLILNLFFGPVVNAAKGIASQINGGLQSFVSNISIPVRPQTIQSYSQGNKNRAFKLTYTISKISCIVLALVSIPIMLEIDFVLKIWLGNNVPQHTSTFAIIIIIDAFLSNLNSAISCIVHASGKMKYYQIAGGIASIVTIILAYYGVRLLKVPEIAFIAILIMDIIRQIVALIIIKRIEPINFKYSDYINNVILPILKVILIGSVVPIICHYTIKQDIIRVSSTIVSSLAFISLSTYYLGLNNNEKNIIAQLTNSIIKRKK